MSFVPKRALGSQGLVVSAQGLGCMGMTAFYGDFNRAEHEEKSLEAIAKSLELGMNMFDTAWVYQSFGADGQENTTNEELLAKAIKIHGREKFIIATKFGFVATPTGFGISGSPETIRTQLADSLKRLGTDYVDLYYQHRMDCNTPIEDTMTCLKSLVQSGQVRYIGLSECTPAEMRRAHAIAPISAIQMEYSLQSRDIEGSVIATARELGIGIVAYAPLGRGFLSATFSNRNEISPTDFRSTRPRFTEENFDQNMAKEFFEYAKKKNCTPAQLALAWLHAQGDDIFPIPGTKTAARVEENLGALKIKLTATEAKEVGDAVPAAKGDRYEEASMTATFNYRM